MKNIKILAAVLALSMTATSCKDYLDINDSPNAVNVEDITPEFLLPGAITQTYRTQAINMMEFGNVMMNSWAGDAYQFGSPYSAEYTLSSVNASFYNQIWDNIYLNVNNFVAVENFPNADGKYDKYVLAAKVMKAFYMQYIVDLYGDAPYTEAFKGQANTTPAYDDDKNIYKSLIAELDNAIALSHNISPQALNSSARDYVFGGDVAKWRKFANTIKLRMLLRMSNVSGDMAAYRDQVLATMPTSASDYITENVTENPGYSSSSDSKMNPFFVTFRVNSSGGATTKYRLITASEHMSIALNGNKYYTDAGVVASSDPNYAKFTGIVDPRRAGLFTIVTLPSGGTVHQLVKGIRQGALSGQEGAPNSNKTISRIGNGSFSGSASLNLTNGNRDGVIMSAAEAYLLLAEASVRYPQFAGINGKQMFENAIDASAQWLGTAIGSYKTQIDGVPGLGWTGSTTLPQKIEAIMTQKWIALTNVNPAEMFIEYNRTGYPYTPMAVSAIQPNKPYRLHYPNSEYMTNSANVPSMTSADCFTINAKTPFWKQ